MPRTAFMPGQGDALHTAFVQGQGDALRTAFMQGQGDALCTAFMQGQGDAPHSLHAGAGGWIPRTAFMQHCALAGWLACPLVCDMFAAAAKLAAATDLSGAPLMLLADRYRCC